jgi:hypothetical protein
LRKPRVVFGLEAVMEDREGGWEGLVNIIYIIKKMIFNAIYT